MSRPVPAIAACNPSAGRVSVTVRETSGRSPRSPLAGVSKAGSAPSSSAARNPSERRGTRSGRGDVCAVDAHSTASNSRPVVSERPSRSVAIAPACCRSLAHYSPSEAPHRGRLPAGGSMVHRDAGEMSPIDPGMAVVVATGVPVSSAGALLQTAWLVALALAWLLTRPGGRELVRTVRAGPQPGAPPGPPPTATR